MKETQAMETIMPREIKPLYLKSLNPNKMTFCPKEGLKAKAFTMKIMFRLRFKEDKSSDLKLS